MAVVSCSTAGGGSAQAASLILIRCKRDKGMGEKREHRPVAWWPCPGDTAGEPLCCAWIYIVKISTYLQSRLRVHKTKKKGDSNIPVRNGRARAVLWRRRIRQVVGRVGWRCTQSNPGVPGPTHTSTLHLPGGSKFDPPGSMRRSCSLSSPKSSAGEMRRRGLLMRRTKGLSNESGGARARSGTMS